MPRRDDIRKVLIIGSGPIVIGQACEFDYSGTQACKALRRLGYQVVLVNSNPATIMTDPVMADETYIEPLNVPTLEKIIAASKPDALLPNLGGQTGLNLSMALQEAGVLDAHGVEMIGVSREVIQRGEDRETFKQTMTQIGVDTPRSTTVDSVEGAEEFASQIGFPLVVRPAYTMGGGGGGFADDMEQLRDAVDRGLRESPINQVLIEESIVGWQELEVEVVRDATDKLVSVCFIENVDAVGVHTGDSFCTAPMLTVAPELVARLEQIAHRIVSTVGVVGGTNVQLAHDPESGRVVVIEINPRTSRSSALASKATGFPIASVSTQLAAGLRLDEIPYWRDGTLDRYTPSGDYVVAKMARWTFEKFPDAQDRLGTQMRAVGEAMSIGKTYKEAFGKAVRSLENGRHGLGRAKNFRELPLGELLERLSQPTSERQYLMYEALRAGASVAQLHEITHISEWFIEQTAELVGLERELEAYAGRLTDLPAELMLRAKTDGMSDVWLAQILRVDESAIRAFRASEGIVQRYEAVPVSGVEKGEYYYSTYQPLDSDADLSDNAPPVWGPTTPKVMVLGGGPNRIGQGIEFDYCCVHAAYTLRDAGFETIMVNCNPETVSTDYDTSGKLYFEPLTVEDVLAIYQREKPEGIVVQFGGQTPLNIAAELEAEGVPILGTSPETIDLAEDRDRFREIMDRLGIPMPPSGMAVTADEAAATASEIGYPVMVRPSYVLGGRGMMIVHNEAGLREYMAAAEGVTVERPILIDRFLDNAMECEADALCDGRDAFVPAVMEQIEYAGIHSGDSACIVPSVNISERHLEVIKDYTRRIAVELGVVGLMNVQYAIHDGTVYVLEANPRASRTVPLVSKVTGVNLARLATQLMLGATLAELELEEREIPFFGAKEAVFPFGVLSEVDPLLGPEMRSTGEVLGMATSPGLAFFKSQEGAYQDLPTSGTVLLTIAERDRVDTGVGSPGANVLAAARIFASLGFRIKATVGTRRFLAEHGIEAEYVQKVHEGSPNMDDDVRSGAVQLVVNSPAGASSEFDDSQVRKSAIRLKVPYVTTTQGALAAAMGIAAQRGASDGVRSLQEYHRMIR